MKVGNRFLASTSSMLTLVCKVVSGSRFAAFSAVSLAVSELAFLATISTVLATSSAILVASLAAMFAVVSAIPLVATINSVVLSMAAAMNVVFVCFVLVSCSCCENQVGRSISVASAEKFCCQR